MKLTNKERLDVATMEYFIPPNKLRGRITENTRTAMAALSSRGIQPKRQTNGFTNLLWGKTYRDLQITQWREDIQAGLITKAEIYESLPAWLIPYVQRSLMGAFVNVTNSYMNLVRKA